MSKIDFNKRVENIIKRLDYLEESCDESVLTDDSISDFLDFSKRCKQLAEKWNKQRTERIYGDFSKKNKAIGYTSDNSDKVEITVDSSFDAIASEAKRLKMLIK